MNRRSPKFALKTFFDTMHLTFQKLTELEDAIIFSGIFSVERCNPQVV